MADRERVNGHAPEIEAPAGTYALLQSIDGGMVGNPFTYRKVTITPAENGSQNLEVLVRVRIRSPQLAYTFEITPEDKVEKLAAKERLIYPRRDTHLPTPEFSKVLGEIQTAIHVNSTPKRVASAV